MKKNRWMVVVVLGLVPALYGKQTQGTNAFVQGTVIRVEMRKEYSPAYTMGGSNPSDAPLTSRFYVYEVAVRVDCKTYVGRYETPFHYLPSAFSANRPIQVRLTRHVLYFDFPDDPEMRMGIVRRRTDCPSSHQAVMAEP